MEKRLYRVKGQVILDVEWETYAESEDEALSNFYAADARDIVNDGKILDVNTDEEEAELVEPIFKVRTIHIDYEVSYGDVADQVEEKFPEVDVNTDEFDDLVYQEIEKIKVTLPQRLDLEIECERDDLDDYVADAVSEETGWLINYCDYEVISER